MSQEVKAWALRRYVVRVHAMDGSVRGTGFFVAPGKVLTCAHVVRSDDQVHLVLASELNSPPFLGTVCARSQLGDPGQAPWPFPDLAVLDIGHQDHPCPPVQAVDPVGSEDCHSYGFPPRQSETPVGSPRRFGFEGRDGDGYLLLKAGQAALGLSGAPLLCPIRRAIVGVVAVTRDADTDLGGWASPMAALLTSEFNVGDELAAQGRIIAAQNLRAAVGGRQFWQDVLPCGPGVQGLEQTWAEFRRRPRSNPSDLLLAEFGVIPYLFRHEDLAAGQRWCQSADQILITNVPAQGGAGKSRFAIELCKRMLEHLWVTGFWRHGTAVAATRAPRLVVVDYAEHVAVEDLRNLITALVPTATPMTPVRMLLLTRQRTGQITDPLENLRREAPASLKAILDDTDESSVAASSLTLGQRTLLYTEALEKFARAWTGTAPEMLVVPDLTDARHDIALDVLFDAFDQVLASESGTEPGKPGLPVDRVLDHEQRYWQRGSPPGQAAEQTRRAVALATLAGAADPGEADALMALVYGDGPESERIRQLTANWISGLYRGAGYLNPLRPDRLGEALIGNVLRENAADGTRLLVAIMAACSDDQLDHTMEVLRRIAAADEHARTIIAAAVVKQHDSLVQRARSQAQGTRSRPGRTILVATTARLLTGAIGEELARVEPANTVFRRNLHVSYNRLADLAVSAGQPEEAERLYRQGLTIAEELAAAEPTNTVFRRDLSVSYVKLGDLAKLVGQSGAKRFYRRALTIAEELAAAEPTNTVFRRDLSVLYNRLGDLAKLVGQPGKAERLYRQALTIDEELAAAEPSNTVFRRNLSLSYSRLGDLARAAGQPEEAERLYRRAVTIAERLVAAEPTNTTFRRDLSLSYSRLGDLARAAGQPEEAERLYRCALTIAEELAAAEPANTVFFRNDISVCYNKLGDLAASVGQPEEAERLYRRALTIVEELAADEPTNRNFRRNVGVSYSRLGDLAVSVGQPGKAERLYRQGLTIAEELAADEPTNTDFGSMVSVFFDRLADLARQAGS